MEINSLTTEQLIETYSDIINQLKERGVIRTKNTIFKKKLKTMKKNILFLIATIVSFAMIANSQPININSSEISINTSTDVYPVVATTDNGYGQNYSIGAEVHALCMGGNCSISKVVVKGRSVSFLPVYGSKKYQFTYDGTTYYFSF